MCKFRSSSESEIEFRKGIKMSTDDYDDEGDLQKCPYCGRAGECTHVLLVVDTTFRIAEGGVLMDAFNCRWSQMCEDGGDDFEEQEPFNNLLDAVNVIADATSDWDYDGGPGMSSGYSSYYVKSDDKAEDALERFESGAGK